MSYGYREAVNWFFAMRISNRDGAIYADTDSGTISVRILAAPLPSETEQQLTG